MAANVSFPRSRYRELRSAWLRRNVGLLVTSAVVILGMLTMATLPLLLWGPPFSATWYLVGGLHTGLVAMALAMLSQAFLAHDRQAINQLRGAWGEENTSDELRSAKRRKLIWGWVDNVGLEFGDLDHFVVTRNGGLIVLDSKFRTDSDLTLTEQLARDSARVRMRANGLANTVLGARARGRRRASGSAVHVRSAVVVWGALQRELSEVVTYEGVPVVPGRQLRTWLASLEGDRITRQAAQDVLARLDEYRLTQNGAKRS